MNGDSSEVTFSVVIPTRNRPELFERALKSVVSQSYPGKQIIVVNDGSTEPYLESYRELEGRYPGVEFHYLVHRPNGHGQSYSMNYGVSRSTQKFICFLDDDDYWTDDRYLEKVSTNISRAGRDIDLHYCNQKAYFSDGTQNMANVWIEDLIPRLGTRGEKSGDAYFVDPEFLLSSKGFAHLNCSVFSRKLYEAIGGMDEGIRYECDRDVYIRAVDAATNILYSPAYNSYHNVPDAKKKDNMSTLISDFEKKLYQLRVYDKGVLLSRKQSVVDFCSRAKTYELKNIATILADNGDYRRAAYYAREALLNRFNLKWLAYTSQLSIRSAFQ